MDNLLPYCGLVDAKIRASDKDLPVKNPKKRIGTYSVLGCFVNLMKPK